jgi:hypothetical protein
MIVPGSQIENSQGRKSKIGPLFFIEGAWYGFVPNHNFKGESDVFEAGTGLLVGNIIRRPARVRHDGYVDIVDAFSVVKFLSYAPIKVGNHRRMACADLVDAMGQLQVMKDPMYRKAAKLISIDGPFLMKSGEEIHHFIGAMEIAAADDGVVLAEQGDSGSAVIVNNDWIVGVLLGVAGSSYYCAPAADLVSRHFPDFKKLEMVA